MQIFSLDNNITDKRSRNFTSCRVTKKYPKPFLKSIRDYGLTCPICGRKMISLDVFHMSGALTLKYLEPYVFKMDTVRRRVYYRLKNESKKYPQKTVKELLVLMAPRAKASIILKRINVLDSIYSTHGRLPKSQGRELVNLCNKYRYINSNHDDKFNFNGNFKYEMVDFINRIKDNKLKKYYNNCLHSLPCAENDENFLIYTHALRNQDNTIMDLYGDYFATLAHIKAYSKGGRVAIWQCNRDNVNQGTESLYSFVKDKTEALNNVYKHIERLVEIYKNTLGVKSEAFSELLKSYITDVVKEIKNVSKNKISPDISALKD